MERDDVEYDDALAGLDFGMLNFDENGNKVSGDDISTGSSEFEVRDPEKDNKGEDNNPEPIENEIDDEDSKGIEDTSDDGRRNTIGVRGEDEIEDTSEPIAENTADDMWSSFASEGIIELEDGELENTEVSRDMEWFATKTKAKMEKDIDEAVDTYKDTLPQEVRYLLDNYESGVSILDLVKADKAVLEYDAIKEDKLEESESMQKSLLADFYRLQGEDEADIKDMVSDAEAAGLLEKQSKRALKKLSNHQKSAREQMIKDQKAQDADNKKAYTERITALKASIDDKDEIIPGIEFNDKAKKKMFEGVTKFDRDGKNEVMRVKDANPDFDLVVAYMATNLIKGGKIDWDKLTTIAKTKATKDLKDQATKGDKRTTSKRGGKMSGFDINIMRSAMGQG